MVRGLISVGGLNRKLVDTNWRIRFLYFIWYITPRLTFSDIVTFWESVRTHIFFYNLWFSRRKLFKTTFLALSPIILTQISFNYTNFISSSCNMNVSQRNAKLGTLFWDIWKNTLKNHDFPFVFVFENCWNLM